MKTPIWVWASSVALCTLCWSVMDLFGWKVLVAVGSVLFLVLVPLFVLSDQLARVEKSLERLRQQFLERFPDHPYDR